MRQLQLASPEEEDHTKGRRQTLHNEENGERRAAVSSGITERCNRLESRQLGSAQVGLAADFLHCLPANNSTWEYDSPTEQS